MQEVRHRTFGRQVKTNRSAGKPRARLRFVRPVYDFHREAKLNEGLFARLDDAISLELASLSKEEVQEGTILLQAFLNWALWNLDADAYALIQKKYLKKTGRQLEGTKFISFVYYCKHKMPQLLNLGLTRGKGKKILDIGCGPGHFQLMAKYFGHEALGLDLPFAPDHPYDSLCEFFRVSKIDYRIEAKQPLPTFPQRFDLVTAFVANFNRHANGSPWGQDDWRFFVEDVCDNILTPDGKLYLTLTGGRWSADGWHYLSSVSEWTQNDHVALIRRDRKTGAADVEHERLETPNKEIHKVVDEFRDQLRNRDEQLCNLTERLSERDEQIRKLSEKVRKRGEQLQRLDERGRERDKRVRRLIERGRKRDIQIQQMKSSFSWQVTFPIRWLSRFFFKPKMRLSA